MSTHENEPERIDDHLSPKAAASDDEGTAEGNPVAGVEISEEDAERAVVPDENAVEVDGPQVGHA